MDLDPQINASQYLVGVDKYYDFINDGHPTIWDVFEQHKRAPNGKNKLASPKDAIRNVVNLEMAVKFICWSFSKNNDAQLVKESLLMATASNRNTPQTIFHSNQGTVYASKVFRKKLEEFDLRVSMSRKGHCWDNAFMESFYHSLKTEMVYFTIFRHLTQAIAHIMDYIGLYNYKRLHSGIGYITPFQVAKLAA